MNDSILAFLQQPLNYLVGVTVQSPPVGGWFTFRNNFVTPATWKTITLK